MNKLLSLLGMLLLATLLAGTACSTSKEYDMFAAVYGSISNVETGEPIAGASVVLSPGGKTKYTGADGAFEFVDLDPQQYTLTVQKPGYSTNRKTVTAVVSERVEVNITLAASK